LKVQLIRGKSRGNLSNTCSGNNVTQLTKIKGVRFLTRSDLRRKVIPVSVKVTLKIDRRNQMNASLHDVNGNSAEVKDFTKESDFFSFASVSVKDFNGNDVTLFFQNVAEILNFSLLIQEKANKLI